MHLHAGSRFANPARDEAGRRHAVGFCRRTSAAGGSAPIGAPLVPSDIQRERMELFDVFEAPHNLPVAAFAKMAGKSRRWISYEIKAGNLLALNVGNRGQRVPDWHLDPLKHELIQSVLKLTRARTLGRSTMHCCNRARCCGAFGTGGRDCRQSRQARHGREHSGEGNRLDPAAFPGGLAAGSGIVAKPRSPRTCQDTNSRAAGESCLGVRQGSVLRRSR